MKPATYLDLSFWASLVIANCGSTLFSRIAFLILSLALLVIKLGLPTND